MEYTCVCPNYSAAASGEHCSAIMAQTLFLVFTKHIIGLLPQWILKNHKMQQIEWSLHTDSREQSFENTFYRTVDTTLPSKHRLMFSLSILSTGKDSGVTFDLSSHRPALLTLQCDDLSHQHLWVQLPGEHLHSRVHQLGTEDGQELLPHGLPLAPFA